MSSAMRWAGPLLTVLAGGILAASAQAIGWALLAGSLLLLVLGRWGRLILGVIMAALGLLGGVQATGQGHRWWMLVASLLALVGGVLISLTAHRWPRRRSRYERGQGIVEADASAQEIWKAMDAGHDPTAD